MPGRRMLLMVGGARKNGTSFSFARTIKGVAEHQGCRADIEFVQDYYEGRKLLSDLSIYLRDCDVIGFVSPMYVDALPASVIWLMEQLGNGLKSGLAGKKMFAVCQCGLPDLSLLQPPLESCRLFTVSTGMLWLGGIGFPLGPVINGTFLENLGRRGRKITAAFSLMVEDIARAHHIRSQVQRMLVTGIPRLFYSIFAVYLNRRSRQAAAKYGVDIARPVYAEENGPVFTSGR